jgi:hypothetical protein
MKNVRINEVVMIIQFAPHYLMTENRCNYFNKIKVGGLWDFR